MNDGAGPEARIEGTLLVCALAFAFKGVEDPGDNVDAAPVPAPVPVPVVVEPEEVDGLLSVGWEGDPKTLPEISSSLLTTIFGEL